MSIVRNKNCQVTPQTSLSGKDTDSVVFSDHSEIETVYQDDNLRSCRAANIILTRNIYYIPLTCPPSLCGLLHFQPQMWTIDRMPSAHHIIDTMLCPFCISFYKVLHNNVGGCL